MRTDREVEDLFDIPPRSPVVFLTGDPGAGKSTLARHISSFFGIPMVSTGDMLRVAGHGSKIADGSFGPDEVVDASVRKWLSEVEDRPGGGVVIDGYPRRPGQVADLIQMVEAYQFRPTQYRVIFLSIAAPEAVRRYKAAGWRRSGDNGNYGPAGAADGFGGQFLLDDIEEHYYARRKRQGRELQDTLDLLRASGLPFTMRKG